MKIYFYSWNKLDTNEENFLIFNNVTSRNAYLANYLVYSVEVNQFLLNDEHNFSKAIDFKDTNADVNTINYIRVEDSNYLPVNRYYYVDRVLQKTISTYNFEFHIDLISTYEHIFKDFSLSQDSFIEQTNLQFTANVNSAVTSKAVKQLPHISESLYGLDELGKTDGSFILYYSKSGSSIVECMVIPCLYYIARSGSTSETFVDKTQAGSSMLKMLTDILLTNEIFGMTINIVKLIWNPTLNYENFGDDNFSDSVAYYTLSTLTNSYQKAYTNTDGDEYYITYLDIQSNIINNSISFGAFALAKYRSYVVDIGGTYIPFENTDILYTYKLTSTVSREATRIYLDCGVGDNAYLDITSYFEISLATSEYEQYRAYNKVQYNVAMDALNRDSSIGGILFNTGLPLASSFVGGVASGASAGGVAGAVQGGFTGISGLISGTWNASDSLCNRWAQINDLKFKPTSIAYRESMGATIYYNGFSIKGVTYENVRQIKAYNRLYGFAVYIASTVNPFVIKANTNFLFYKYSKVQFKGAYNKEIMQGIYNKLISGIRLWYKSANYLDNDVYAFEANNLE